MAHARLSVRPARRSRRLIPTAALVAVSLTPAFFLTGRSGPHDAVAPPSPVHHVEAPSPAASAALTRPADGLGDHGLVLKPDALGLDRDVPLQDFFGGSGLQPRREVRGPLPETANRFALANRPPVTRGDPVTMEPAVVPPAAQEPVAPITLASAADPVPLPTPRPSDGRWPRTAEPPAPRSPLSRPMRRAAAPAAPLSNPSFFERLFGVKPVPDAALSYAALDPNLGGAASGSRLGLAPAPSAGPSTAIYDITARIVHLPNGEKLEAHSGLGDKLDDPQYVHVRMRGATPPGTYDLTERERLFHGVRAIRLTPVGGSAAIHGRDGLLAHTYMLGPNGDSNGCVSFRNYDRFLQAYLRGEVKRLVVVAGRGRDALPRFASNRD